MRWLVVLAALVACHRAKPDHADRVVIEVNASLPGASAEVVAVEEDAQVELDILHRGQFPSVDLAVHGDPHAAIGTVPAGVTVEVE